MTLSQVLRRLRQRLRVLTDEQRNALWLYLDVGFLGVLSGGALAFLPIYVVRSGATPTLVSLLSSLPALTGTLACMPAGRLVERTHGLVRLTMTARLGLRAAFLIFAILPLFLPQHQPLAFVVVWTIAAVPMAYANVGFTTLLAEAVSPGSRAQVVSTRLAIHGISSAATGFLAGRSLDLLPYPANYQLIFAAGFGFGLLSIYCLSKVRLPALRPHGGKAAVPAVQQPGLRQRWLALRQTARENGAFTRFQLTASWFRLGIAVPSALFSLYWVNVLNAPDTWIGVMVTLQRVFAIVGYFAWGQLAIRRGDRLVLVLSTLGLSSYPLLTALASTPAGLIPAAVAGGLFSAGVEVAFLNVLLTVCPPQRRAQLVAANSMLANLLLFVGPLLGAALAETVGLRPVLYCAAAMRLSGGVLFYTLRIGAQRRRAVPRSAHQS